eukprot:SAG31_NODE_2004_length_6685_cov_2.189341_6_plen_61_part_00
MRKEMMRLGIAIVIIKRARLIGIPTTEYLNSLRHNCIKSRSLDDWYPMNVSLLSDFSPMI